MLPAPLIFGLVTIFAIFIIACVTIFKGTNPNIKIGHFEEKIKYIYPHLISNKMRLYQHFSLIFAPLNFVYFDNKNENTLKKKL